MDRERTPISAQEVQTTAELARLLVADAELEPLRAELSAMLAYAAQLDEIDVTGVVPMTHAVELRCPLRADVVVASDALASAQANAPAMEGSFFVVPAVFAPDPGAGPRDRG